MEKPEPADPTLSKSSTLDDDSGQDNAAAIANSAHVDTPKAAHPLSCKSSTLDDDSGKDSDRIGSSKPWWENHPELEAITARVEAEIYSRPERPESHTPDPVLADYLSGDSVRELRNAREELAQAKVRYANAVHAARTAGLSWAQIGVILGVARQQLHRRFRHLTN
ncbi:hypothetical protein NGTWS0302_35560 [Mycolicibacterium cyprinidarum]|uniref:Sigma-70 family RNA polymerase sigma factor n=1 Tax=Mycolicibacterium cyprinidarum TaxID=2860311 RepID=A0ABQ4V5U9_9MYCO|nr:hypothetical protein NGTWS1702_34430 [Mycolicibacterium sp. NGTWSNA01]GJF14137.1 hypothetical protein NGTWS0302_35560 [Mycolicibacterium sp. NGTWS0302]